MIKVGLIGLGSVGRRYHLPCYLSLRGLASLEAVCDVDQKRLREVTGSLGVKGYTDIEDMLRKEELDMVDITTPSFRHYEQCQLAIENGINVLVEKPITLAVHEVREIDSKASSSGVKVCVMQNYRFRDPVRTLISLQEAGQIGQLSSMFTSWHGGSFFGGPRWCWNENDSGGILYENGVHIADLHCFLLGPHTKLIATYSRFDSVLNLTTQILALVKHSYGVGLIDLRWFSSSTFFRTDISGSISDVVIKLQPDNIAVYRGELRPLLETFSEIRRMYDFSKPLLLRKFRSKSIEPHRRVIERFIHAIRDDTDAPVPVKDVLPTMALLEDIRNAANTNREILE